MKLVGAIRLPGVGLVVRHEALGCSFPASVESGTFVLHLPARGSPERDGPDLERPPVDVRVEPPRDSDGIWGFAHASDHVRVLTVGFTAEIVGLESLDGFGADFNRWYLTVAEWMYLWTGRLVDQDLGPHMESSGRAWRVDSADSRDARWFPPWRVPTVHLDPGASATAEQVQSAFNCASSHQLPPVEWLIFMKAQRQSDQRLAVIEAATAAEVALSRAVTGALPNFKAEAIERIIQNANGLVGLRDLLAVLTGSPGPVSRGRLAAQLAEPRNRAAHRGEAPTRRQVLAALATARALLSGLCPMPER